MRCFFLAVCLFAVAPSLHAQHENDNWYFGYGCALSFSGGTPAALPDGALWTTEGCSSISDSAGNLLFYTDGMTVYNKNHQQMPNGFGLLGAMSSTQSALIVKDPGAANMFYIFTTPESFNLLAFHYSRVDMTLDGGLGDVTVKNAALVADADEKCAAIVNAAGDGYWVLTHTHPNNLYYAYPVTATGIGAPVVSTGAAYVGLNPAFGHIKLSSNGFLANCMFDMCALEVAHFNDTTGVVSGSFIYQLPISDLNHLYGAEFSPSGNKLYFGNVDESPGTVYQMDMTAGSPTDMINSVQLIHEDTVTIHGALQLGPDGKIYVVNFFVEALDVITNPELSGAACGYTDSGVALNAPAAIGLPNCVANHFTNYVQPQASIQPLVTKICPDSCISFGNTSTNASDYEWFFQGGNPSYSTDAFPVVCFEFSGNYDVTLIAHNGPYSDTVLSNNLIQVYDLPQPIVMQSNDTLYCTNVAVNCTYQWFLNTTPITGSTNPFCIPTQPGTYTVQATSLQGCSNNADIEIVSTDDIGYASGGCVIFPNPAVESFTLTTGWSDATLVLYNALGQLKSCTSLHTNKTTIDTHNFAAGVYTLVVQNKNGVAVKRLVIADKP
jgi:hypothetical protein